MFIPGGGHGEGCSGIWKNIPGPSQTSARRAVLDPAPGVLSPQVPPTTSSLQASTKAYCANQCRLHSNPGPGLGRTQVTAHKHIPLLLFLDSSHRQSALLMLCAPLVSPPRPRLQAPPIPRGTLPRLRPSAKPCPSPGSSHGPRSLPRLLPRLWSRPGLRSLPRPALLARPQAPPRSWRVAREAYGLLVWSFASGRPEGRRFGPSVPVILEFLYWSRGRGRWRQRGPHARGESAATNRRAWRRQPRESAAQTEAVRRALRAEGRGRRAGW